MRNKIIEEDLEFIIASDIPWDTLEGKTILISGANGFLPAYMVETILFLNERRFKKKAKILALVRNKERFLQRFTNYKDREDLQVIIQDVCKPINITKNVNFIVHAASQASPNYYGRDPVGTLCPNVLGTYHLLELAREKEVENFLFFSSGEVYGEVSSNRIPTKEEWYGYVDPTNIRSCYAESKRMGETMCVSWFCQYGVPAKIVRPFHTYGPGMRLDDGRVYADFVSDIINKRNIRMNSDGSAIRAFCYLADAMAGFFTVLFNGSNGEAYNIGNNNCEISILELANELVALFPEYGLTVERNIVADDKMYLKSNISKNSPDITKAKSLGWEPRFDIKQGFKRTILSYCI
jgi:nucleoside-diphosphate-sugar epimerase